MLLSAVVVVVVIARLRFWYNEYFLDNITYSKIESGFSHPASEPFCVGQNTLWEIRVFHD